MAEGEDMILRDINNMPFLSPLCDALAYYFVGWMLMNGLRCAGEVSSMWLRPSI